MKFVEFKGVQLRYATYGQAKNEAIVLLHGYLESLEIWDGFTKILSEHFYVVSLDIPGHGESGIYSAVHRMDELAESVSVVCKELKLKKVHIVGHSMGGYVALAFRENYHHMVMTCSLFHSTCYPDTKEKRDNRNREIQLVKNGKKDLIVNTNIPRAFADDNVNSLSKEIEKAISIALETPDDGICAILNGMKRRPDRCKLMYDDKIPLLIIAGKKDNYIPYEVMEKIKQIGTNVEVQTLENSGHMGFIEEPEESFRILSAFFQKHRPQ